MKHLLKTLHIVSLSIFIGSIATYIFFGALVPEGNELAMVLSRDRISTSTNYLTLPALWATGVTGILMSGKPQQRWIWAKLVGFIGIALNTHLFIYPAILKSQSSLGINDESFQLAMQQEAMFGAVNIVLILVVISIAVIKPKLFSK